MTYTNITEVPETEVQELSIIGTQQIAGVEFTGIEGGFCEGKRAMLAKDIAEIHGKKLIHVNELINKNINRFKGGIDIVDLKVIGQNDNNLKVVGQNDYNFESMGFTKMQVSKANNIYLLSERGYAKLLKILEDDLAWELYDKLVDGYFNMRAEQQPKTELELIQATVNQMVAQSKRVEVVEQKVIDLEENIPLFSVECEEVSRAVNKHGVKLLGGKSSKAYRTPGVRSKVYRDIYNQLRREFGVTSYKAIKRRHLKAALEIVSEHKLPIALCEEIDYANMQLGFDDKTA